MAKQKLKEESQAGELATALGLSFVDVKVRQSGTMAETVRVKEFELEQIGELMPIIQKLWARLGGNAPQANDLLTAGEVGIELMMAATHKPREWFKRLPLGDGLALAAGVIVANPSFFEHLADIKELVGFLEGILPGTTKVEAGPSSSDSLPVADTLLM